MSRRKILVCFLIGIFLTGSLFGSSKIHVYAGKNAFVPSITSKGAPDVQKAVDKDGKDVTDLLVITPYGDRDDMQDYKKKEIEEAYHKVEPSKLVEEINKKIQSGDIPLPEKWQIHMAPHIDEKQISIKDIFYIHEKDDRGLINPTVKVTMDPKVSKNQLIVVMYYDGKEWKTVPFTRNADGTITITVKDYGPYMIITNTVVEKSGTENDPSSPQTGEEESTFSYSVLGILAGILLISICKMRTHRFRY